MISRVKEPAGPSLSRQHERKVEGEEGDGLCPLKQIAGSLKARSNKARTRFKTMASGDKGKKFYKLNKMLAASL